MKANVKVTLKGREFPAGTQQGLFRFRIKRVATGDVVDQREDAGLEVTFGPLEPAQYEAVVAALDAAGNVLGEAMAMFDIVAPQLVTLSVPAAVSVELIPQ